MKKLLIIVLVIVVAAIGWRVHDHSNKPLAAVGQDVSQAKQAAQKANQPKTTACTKYVSGKVALVSVSQQHMWACSNGSVVYESAVITGMQQYPSELTPPGTYSIYAKQIDQTLAGQDFTGSWSDFVYYWLPFLNNKYGTYGFHDLTQSKNGSAGRAASDFGNIDINAPYTAAKHGSHGCVELPLATAKWLYDWASVGTKVVINS